MRVRSVPLPLSLRPRALSGSGSGLHQVVLDLKSCLEGSSVWPTGAVRGRSAPARPMSGLPHPIASSSARCSSKRLQRLVVFVQGFRSPCPVFADAAGCRRHLFPSRCAARSARYVTTSAGMVRVVMSVSSLVGGIENGCSGEGATSA